MPNKQNIAMKLNFMAILFITMNAYLKLFIINRLI